MRWWWSWFHRAVLKEDKLWLFDSPDSQRPGQHISYVSSLQILHLFPARIHPSWQAHLQIKQAGKGLGARWRQITNYWPAVQLRSSNQQREGVFLASKTESRLAPVWANRTYLVDTFISPHRRNPVGMPTCGYVQWSNIRPRRQRIKSWIEQKGESFSRGYCCEGGMTKFQRFCMDGGDQDERVFPSCGFVMFLRCCHECLSKPLHVSFQSDMNVCSKLPCLSFEIDLPMLRLICLGELASSARILEQVWWPSWHETDDFQPKNLDQKCKRRGISRVLHMSHLRICDFANAHAKMWRLRQARASKHLSFCFWSNLVHSRERAQAPSWLISSLRVQYACLICLQQEYISSYTQGFMHARKIHHALQWQKLIYTSKDGMHVFFCARAILIWYLHRHVVGNLVAFQFKFACIRLQSLDSHTGKCKCKQGAYKKTLTHYVLHDSQNACTYTHI